MNTAVRLTASFFERLFLCVAVVAAARPAGASEWPEFRGGAARTGVWNEPGLPAILPLRDCAGPADAGGKMFTLGRDGALRRPRAGGAEDCVMDATRSQAPMDTERLLCLDASDGKPQWQATWPRAIAPLRARLRARPCGTAPRPCAMEKFSRPVPHGGSELRCVDVTTGAVKWTEKGVTRLKGFAHATVTRNAANDTWYLTNDQGELILAKTDAAGYRELARASLTAKTWTYPAYANRRIYTRSETSLVCFALD